jgi:hypothetical protein
MKLFQVKPRTDACSEVERKLTARIRKHDHREEIEFSSIAIVQAVRRIFRAHHKVSGVNPLTDTVGDTEVDVANFALIAGAPIVSLVIDIHSKVKGQIVCIRAA